MQDNKIQFKPSQPVDLIRIVRERININSYISRKLGNSGAGNSKIMLDIIQFTIEKNISFQEFKLNRQIKNNFKFCKKPKSK